MENKTLMRGVRGDRGAWFAATLAMRPGYPQVTQRQRRGIAVAARFRRTPVDFDSTSVILDTPSPPI